MYDNLLLNIFSQILKLSPEDVIIAELGSPPQWDSITHIKIAQKIEQAYNIKFTIPELRHAKTYADFKKILHENKKIQDI